MGIRFTGWAALVLLAGFTAQPAQAKDRKSAAPRDRAAVADWLATRDAAPKSVRQDLPAMSGSSAAVVRSSSDRNGKPTAPLSGQVARSGPLHFKLGAITVRPAVGGIKGAQFSIGF